MHIEKLFSPSSVAVIGASTRPGNVGNDIVKNLTTQGFGGEIYPVNPKATELYGKKCYATIADIPGSVDLAIVVVPAVAVVDVAREAAEKGVGAIIVISAGFREVGNMQAEEDLKKLCDEKGIALLGPNCLGVINPHLSMNASFATRIPQMGDIAFLSQSGALCTAMLDYAAKERIGFSKFASIGNKAQLDEVALMKFLATDSLTRVVVLYAEQLNDADGFTEAVHVLREAGKPVLVVKSGATAAGSGASASHTGALAGNDAVYDALFARAGAIRVRDFDDVFEYLSGFDGEKLPTGDRTAVITNAGGPGVLATDEIVLQNLELAQLSEQTKSALVSFLPAAANTHNPVDVLGDADAARYEQSLAAILADDNVDNVVVVLTPQSMTQIAETAQCVARLAKESKKFVCATFMGATDVEAGMGILRVERIPVSRFPQKAVRTLAAMRHFAKRLDGKEAVFENFSKDEARVREIQSRYSEGGNMSTDDAMAFFDAYGFAVTKSAIAKTPEEAVLAAQAVGGLAVMKIMSPDVLHKSDAGGVKLGVTPENAREEFSAMIARVGKNVPGAKLEGVLLAEMITEKGVEFILGSVKDPNLGSAVMAGFGGVYVEVFRDVAFGAVPVSKTRAQEMIESLKSKALLRGARGGEMLDEEAFLESIGRMSQLLAEHPEILEADMNPVLVFSKGKGVKILDARITLEKR